MADGQIHPEISRILDGFRFPFGKPRNGPRANDGTYCSTLTDSQVQNVYQDEINRMNRCTPGSEVWEAANKLREEAKTEMARRGLI